MDDSDKSAGEPLRVAVFVPKYSWAKHSRSSIRARAFDLLCGATYDDNIGRDDVELTTQC